MKVELLSYTNDLEKLIAGAASLCYSGKEISTIFEDLDEETINRKVNMLVDLGHLSALEHVSFTFGIEGVSRITEQQLTRHRIASYSIQSGRYVKRDPEFVIPESIYQDGALLRLYTKACEDCKKTYNDLTDALQAKYEEQGLSKSKAEKKALEDARYVLPQSMQTKIICTFNLRSLINFTRHRSCNRAQWEIRELSDLMIREVNKISPTLAKLLGAPCMVGKPCPEGKMSCRKPRSYSEVLEECKHENVRTEVTAGQTGYCTVYVTRCVDCGKVLNTLVDDLGDSFV